MISRTIYIANDGKQFADPDECMAYEIELGVGKFKDEAFLFDIDLKPLTLTEEHFDEARVIRCSTTAAAEFLNNTFGKSIYSPWDRNYPVAAGCWVWNDDTDCWEDVSEVIGELGRLTQRINRLKEIAIM